jgi:hypothetical protein
MSRFQIAFKSNRPNWPVWHDYIDAETEADALSKFKELKPSAEVIKIAFLSQIR